MSSSPTPILSSKQLPDPLSISLEASIFPSNNVLSLQLSQKLQDTKKIRKREMKKEKSKVKVKDN